MSSLIYFDIDGVLNDTPQRGNKGFYADPAKCELLQQIPGQKVCISFWRGTPQRSQVILPFDFTFAAHGEKRSCCPNAKLIIDDQPNLYNWWEPIYTTNGSVGLTEDDLLKILELLK